jgi:PAS domain S-box-containing protein
MSATSAIPQGSAGLSPRAIAPPGGWESLLDVVESAIVVTDLDGVIGYWSRGAEVLYGWTPAEAVGQPVRSLLRTEAGLREDAWSGFRAGRTWSGDVEITRRDGSPVTAWATVSPLRDADGRVVGVVGLSRDVTVARAQEALLRESESRFEQLATHLPVVFWMTDVATGRLLYISPAFEHIWGQPVESVYADPRSYRAAIHPDDRPRIEQILNGRRAPGDLQYRIIRPDGSIRWVHDFSYPIAGPDGAPIRFAGIVTDVTAQVASERELAAMNASLRESESRFNELAEHIEAVFWLVEPGTDRLLYVSPSVERMFGITGAEMRADPERYWSLIHPDDRARVRGLLERPTGEVEIEYRLVRPDGTQIWVNDRSFPIRDEAGNVLRLAGIGTDVTARHRSEQDRVLLTAAIEQTSDGMLLIDTSGTIAYANPAFEQISGFAVDDLVGTRADDLTDTVDMPGLANAIETVAAGSAWSGTVLGRRPDGDEYDARLSIWPLDQPGVVERNVVVVLRDVTRLREAERALAAQRTERAAIAEALKNMKPAPSLEATAASVLREINRLDGVVSSKVVGFDGSDGAWVVAADGPDGIPSVAGERLPSARAAFLRSQAAAGSPPEPFTARSVDGPIGRAWERLGVTAMGWIPLRRGDQLLGVIAVSTDAPDGTATLTSRLPTLHEYGALAAALLGSQLVERVRREDARRRIGRMIETRGFHPVYQPVVELASGTVVGYEALTRFEDGLSPDLHFREAAASDMGLDLESAALRAAEEQCLQLPDQVWLSINVSPEMVLDGGAIRGMMDQCRRQLVLEVTEHSPVADYAALRAAVAELNHGARLAVDDAGAGFASLRHIIELRPDFVKLDIGLVRGVDADTARQSIVAGMVHFAATTGCSLIAEGVETQEEQQTLLRLGVTLGQGYLFGRPQPMIQAPSGDELVVVD